MERWLVTELEQKRSKVSLEHLVAPEREKKVVVPKFMGVGVAKGHRSQLKGGQVWVNFSIKINKDSNGINPSNKIGIHGSKLIIKRYR